MTDPFTIWISFLTCLRLRANECVRRVDGSPARLLLTNALGEYMWASTHIWGKPSVFMIIFTYTPVPPLYGTVSPRGGAPSNAVGARMSSPRVRLPTNELGEMPLSWSGDRGYMHNFSGSNLLCFL